MWPSFTQEHICEQLLDRLLADCFGRWHEQEEQVMRSMPSLPIRTSHRQPNKQGVRLCWRRARGTAGTQEAQNARMKRAGTQTDRRADWQREADAKMRHVGDG